MRIGDVVKPLDRNSRDASSILAPHTSDGNLGGAEAHYLWCDGSNLSPVTMGAHVPRKTNV